MILLISILNSLVTDKLQIIAKQSRVSNGQLLKHLLLHAQGQLDEELLLVSIEHIYQIHELVRRS